jgi:hypothetical protein
LFNRYCIRFQIIIRYPRSAKNLETLLNHKRGDFNLSAGLSRSM